MSKARVKSEVLKRIFRINIHYPPNFFLFFIWAWNKAAP